MVERYPYTLGTTRTCWEAVFVTQKRLNMKSKYGITIMRIAATTQRPDADVALAYNGLWYDSRNKGRPTSAFAMWIPPDGIIPVLDAGVPEERDRPCRGQGNVAPPNHGRTET